MPNIYDLGDWNPEEVSLWYFLRVIPPADDDGAETD
jgi:hypothetical protein